MTAEIDLAEAIATRVAAIGNTPGFPTAGMVLTDFVGNMSMHRGLMRDPLAHALHTPAALPAIDAAVALAYPPPRTSPFTPEHVIGEIEMAFGGTGLITAVDKLSQLNWPDRHTVLESLATRRPGLETGSYLSLLQGALDALPNVDTGVRAAWLATRLAKAPHEVGAQDATNWATLMTHALTLPFEDMTEVFVAIGFAPEEVPTLVADLIADLEEEGIDLPLGAVPLAAAGFALPPGWFNDLKNTVLNFNKNRTDFLEYKRNPKQHHVTYIGIAVHTAIAVFYRAQHASHVRSEDDRLVTNTTPIERIFNFLSARYSGYSAVGQLARRAAISRPDIFELVAMHGQPPGWVYEIKPAGAAGDGVLQAAREALMYAAMLSVWSIPARPGPPNTAGTFGTVPIPGGWAAFVCPAPGAIVYKPIYAPQEKYRLKFPQTADARKEGRAETRAKLEAAVAAGAATAAIAAAAYAIARLVAQYGWRLLLL